MIKKSVYILLVIFVACSSLSAQERGDYKIVINRSNSMEMISNVKLSQVFLKKVTSWDNGETILPVDLMDGSPLRETFTLKVHKRSIKKIKSYWKRQVFTKKSVPPPQLMDETDVLAFVASDPGAIGYVSSSTPIRGYAVKVLVIEN